MQALVELFEVVFKLIKLTDGTIPVVGKVYWECFKIQEYFESLPSSDIYPSSRATGCRPSARHV